MYLVIDIIGYCMANNVYTFNGTDNQQSCYKQPLSCDKTFEFTFKCFNIRVE